MVGMARYHLFVVTTSRQQDPGTVPWSLEANLFSCEAGPDLLTVNNRKETVGVKPDAVLIDLDTIPDEKARQQLAHSKQLGVPVFGVVSEMRLPSYDTSIELDDFIVQPFSSGELLTRLDLGIFRLNGHRRQKTIRVGDLLIDPERYEVSLAGKKLLLTYKEYQLLGILASNPGKVFTRENLLNQVWGYEYFGGTRTVDVHIRRLRSKIEDASHSFIGTIWNVGYRFTAIR